MVSGEIQSQKIRLSVSGCIDQGSLRRIISVQIDHDLIIAIFNDLDLIQLGCLCKSFLCFFHCCHIVSLRL